MGPRPNFGVRTLFPHPYHNAAIMYEQNFILLGNLLSLPLENVGPITENF